MIIPKYARYERSVKLSCEFLEEFDISRFPIDPFAIIENKKWGLLTYSEMAAEYNCTIDDTIISLKSKDGFTIYDGDNFTIAYNDAQPKKRILFTLLHEIGHVYLNHLIDFEHTTLYRGSLTKSENKVLENEANTFARNVLAPATFVRQLKDKTKMSLSRRFGISYPAAETRLELLESDCQRVENAVIRVRLYRLLYMYQYRYGCGNCKAIVFIKSPTFCPICGKKKLKWGGGEVKYRKFEVHEKTNKVKFCPTCNNEETDIEGDFCQICGKPLINRCDDRGWDNYPSDDGRPCGKPVPSNARYCPHCGNKTTFFNDEMLKDWQVERREQDEEETLYNKVDYFMEIPDGIDEELPFN
jgi:Zn-dependent peptidase ImmA (M78 family)/rRNA maturation endonuclease Nob1